MRLFGSLSLICALAIGGYLFAAQSKSQGPSSRQVSTAIQAGQMAEVALNFQQAAAALEQSRSLNGTYAGTDLGGYGVTLVRADSASYCLQAGAYHETGPSGVPTPGAC